MQLSILQAALFTLFTSTLASAVALTLQVPPHIPALSASTKAYLIAHNSTLFAPITRANSFIFNNLPRTDTTTASYLLEIACRDYDFASYGVDVKSDGVVEIYRVGRGGWDQGGRVVVGDGPLELRVLKARDFYDKRTGCTSL